MVRFGRKEGRNVEEPRDWQAHNYGVAKRKEEKEKEKRLSQHGSHGRRRRKGRKAHYAIGSLALRRCCQCQREGLWPT